MPLIQPGQKFRVCANFEGSYLVPGEILTIQAVAPDNTVEFLAAKGRGIDAYLPVYWNTGSLLKRSC